MHDSEFDQEAILDHSRRPRNFRAMPSPDRVGVGRNPVCNDAFEVLLRITGDTIDDIAVQGKGCAISTASASMMTDAVKGVSLAEARSLAEGFNRFMIDSEADHADAPDSLAPLAGVKRFPIRVKCATLPWHTLIAALDGRADSISTET